MTCYAEDDNNNNKDKERKGEVTFNEVTVKSNISSRKIIGGKKKKGFARC